MVKANIRRAALYKHSRIKFAIVTLLLTASCGSKVAMGGAVESGRQLVEKMSNSMQQLNYIGTFVYVHNAGVETMHITHSKDDDVERERLYSLNGEAREIIRNNESVICIWPGTKSVSVSKAAPRTPFPEFARDELAALEKLYTFQRITTDRVAGRDAVVVDIIPRDDFRYGYRLWIDSETSLMLRSVMSDQRQRVIEQVMFTEIEFVDSIPVQRFEPSGEGTRQEWLAATESLRSQVDLNSDIPKIEKLDVPAGFTLMSDKVLQVSEDSIVRRIIYTDSLASLSVFISHTSEESKNLLEGLTGMGAVHAYGVMRGSWHVTVVGEVPQSTVRQMGDTIKLATRQ